MALGYTDFFVVAENSVVFDTKLPTSSLYTAMLTLLALYHTLHISYPSRSQPAASMMFFMQDVLLDRPDFAVKKPKTYTSFY